MVVENPGPVCGVCVCVCVCQGLRYTDKQRVRRMVFSFQEFERKESERKCLGEKDKQRVRERKPLLSEIEVY